MTSKLKVNLINDSGDNNIITSDGSGNVTLNSTLGNFTSTGIDDNATSTEITIASDGDIGIGTTSPDGSDFGSGTGILHLKDIGSNNTGIKIEDGTTKYVAIVNGGGDAYTGMWSNNNYRFYTNSTERMRILNTGNILINTTSTTINTSNFGTKITNGLLSTSGNVNGGSTVTESFGNAGQIRFMGDGDAENTNNSYGGLSDRTLKENETSANSQWDDIKALQIKNYNLIEYPDRPQIGVIAQDLEEAGMNGLVKTDDEGLKSVKYSVLYMKAVKCLQEAQTKIETLESTVSDLTTRLEALENA